MNDVLLNLLGITLFLLIIAASIGLHEWGHFATARAFGVKVTEFMIGFGPTIAARVAGETTYGLKAIPVGGYVRIIGMYPPSPDAPPGMQRVGSTGRFAALMDTARAQSMAEIGPGDADRVFYKLPVRKRVVVMMAGPVMNLIIATVLFTAVLVGIGLPTATTTVSQLVPCTPTVANPAGAAAADGSCASAPSPSADSAVRAGDEFVVVNGRPVATWEDITAALGGAGAGQAVSFTVLRDGRRITSEAVLAEATYPVLDEDGNPTGDTQSRPFFGVRPEFAYVPLAVTEVPAYMWDLSVLSAQALITLPVRVLELAGTLATGGERDPDGPVSVVGVTRLGGEIAALEEPLQAKVATFLGLAASLNLFLFLFNLLPLLPLDGGHVAAALWEGGRRQVARWRDRPDPGPVDTVRLLPVTYAVVAVLLSVSVIVIWADLVKPITLRG